MRILLVLVSLCVAFAAGDATGKGRRSSSSSVPRTQYVHGYDRADGIHVNGYYRSPGSRGSVGIARATSATAGLGGFDADDTGWAKGLSKQIDTKPAVKPECAYADVMTNEEIAVCRQE